MTTGLCLWPDEALHSHPRTGWQFYIRPAVTRWSSLTSAGVSAAAPAVRYWLLTWQSDRRQLTPGRGDLADTTKTKERCPAKRRERWESTALALHCWPRVRKPSINFLLCCINTAFNTTSNRDYAHGKNAAKYMQRAQISFKIGKFSKYKDRITF